MTVVSDTSSICYLVLIEAIEILPNLFDRVFIPQAVYEELTAEGSPEQLRLWLSGSPDWLEVCSVEVVEDPELDILHRGERDAIRLAEKFSADLIVIDEKSARKVAKLRGLKVTGLLGVLKTAARRNLIDPITTIQRLKQTSFRVSSSLLDSIFQEFDS